MNNEITLTKEDCRDAAKWGIERRLTNIFKEVENKNKFKPISGTWWGNDIEASGAELAFSKFINEDWVGLVNTFHGPDVGKDWQVRYTNLEYGSLIIRESDKTVLHHRFVLVTGLMPTYKIIGYIVGNDARKKEFVKNPNNEGKAYFVPQNSLIKF